MDDTCVIGGVPACVADIICNALCSWVLSSIVARLDPQARTGYLKLMSRVFAFAAVAATCLFVCELASSSWASNVSAATYIIDIVLINLAMASPDSLVTRTCAAAYMAAVATAFTDVDAAQAMYSPPDSYGSWAASASISIAYFSGATHMTPLWARVAGAWYTGLLPLFPGYGMPHPW
jgi:hypothetical protein